MRPRTRIVCTIGPASREPDTLRALMEAGLDVARLNFSHGTREEHAGHIRALRAVAQERGAPIAILQDLAGPRLPGGPFLLQARA